MHKEKEIRKGDGGGGAGAVYVVGIGPGGIEDLTARAKDAIGRSEVVVGYTRYVDLISPLTAGKEVLSTGMMHEVERCRMAIGAARSGKKVAVVSSGDSGIYGMAGLVYQLIGEDGASPVTVEVIPGVPAFVSAASILGAPLMHDFASISLSDLLTDRALIEKRLHAAASADFVIILYNPRSTKRVEGLTKAVDIILEHRAPATPAGIVRNASREDEHAIITTLGGIKDRSHGIDMLTIIIIGNSASFTAGGRIITPRGYKGV